MISSLSELCLCITKGTTPSTVGFNFEEAGVNFIKSEQLVSSRNLSLTNRYFISSQAHQYLKRSQLQENDILISIAGAYLGKLALVHKTNLPANTNQAVGIVRVNPDLIHPVYLFYHLSTERMKHTISSFNSQSAQPNINLTQLGSLPIDVPDFSEQLHIVNTIGSVDELIENYQQQISDIYHIGLCKINCLNDLMNKTNLSSICKLEKGVEIGSKNYIEKSKEGLIHYLRVGDLDNLSSTYIEENISKNMALEDDILIAFDGAPGRNSIGISGAFSSGIYKIICDKTNKGLVYFQINSLLNQKIISDHSQGTTILHASKAIPYLQCCICSEKDINFFDNLFVRMVSLKKKITTLKIVKKQLLLKYF